MHPKVWVALVVVLASISPGALAVTAVGSAAVAAGAAPMTFVHAGPQPATFHSTNWAGYAVTGANGSVRFVNGSWIQPKVTCASTGTVYYVAFWVGIDGFTSTTVEQTGTLAECLLGVTAYYAWYEFYPSGLVQLTNVVVHPGNVFHASVRFVSTTVGFRTTLTDVSTGKHGSHTQTVAGAWRNSAEWIAEAPYSGGILPLANFGTVKFGTDATGVGLTDDATIHGVTHAIGGFAASAIHPIDMVTISGSLSKANTSALTPDGTSFNITWKRAGP